MAAKITEAVAKEIIRLHEDQIDASEIAQLLDLKKMQVKSILAFYKPTHIDETVPFSVVAAAEGGEPDAMDAGSDNLSGSAIVKEYTASAAESEVYDSQAIKVPNKTEKDGAEEEGIFVGNDKEFGDALFWDPQNAAEVQNPHMMIVGESGSGNPNTISVTNTANQAAHATNLFRCGPPAENLFTSLPPLHGRYNESDVSD